MTTPSAPRRLLAAAALVLGGIALTPLAAAAGPGGVATPTIPPPPPTLPGSYQAPTLPLPDLTVETWDATESDGEVQGRLALSAPLDEDLFVTVNPLFITTSEWDFSCPSPGGGGCGWYVDVTIPAGATQADFEMSVVEDDGPEGAELFGFDPVVWDDGIVDVGPPAQATLHDGAGLELDLADAEAWEGDVGSHQTLDFVVTASQAPAQDLTFGFHTAIVGFGATPGVDHEAVDVEVVLPAGATQVTIEVPIHGDLLDEADEVLFGHITDPSEGEVALSGGVAVGRILDDDGRGEGPGPAKGLQAGGGFRTR